MSQELKKVIISSTARDLPKHRKEVMNACLQQDMLPKMMEHLPPSDAEAISASLSLVKEADIYIGIFAHRYGYVPQDNNPQQISITEMEYDYAVDLEVSRLIFIIDTEHPLTDFTINDIDMGENAVKLTQFKSRIEKENIVKYFKSPEDLRAHAISGLSEIKIKSAPLGYVKDRNIFIAHSSFDWKNFAKPLVERLQAEGLYVRASKNFKQHQVIQIKRALDICDLLVLCVTTRALKSKLIKMCYDYFIESNKNIFLLICQETEPLLPKGLTQALSWRFTDMEQLIKLIKLYKVYLIQSSVAKYKSR
jgi:hypothetical protein